MLLGPCRRPLSLLLRSELCHSTLTFNLPSNFHSTFFPSTLHSILPLTAARGCSNKAQEHYVQGQEPSPGIREYFYYVDHQGMLFQDDSRMKHFTAAIKEQKLLFNFFKRLRLNDTGRYDEFKYLSLCGRERNFVRCDDRPIVFISVAKIGQEQQKEQQEQEQGRSRIRRKIKADPDQGQGWHLLFNHAGEKLVQRFEPSLVTMVPSTGRVYHPGPRLSGGVGLISDRLAILWTEERRFVFDNGEEEPPTSFRWEGVEVPLTHELLGSMTGLEKGEGE